MGFGSFLKKLGSVLITADKVVAQEAPLIAPFLPSKAQGALLTAGASLDAVAGVVVTTEQMFASLPSAKGTDKLEAAAPFVAAIVKQLQVIDGKKIQDQAKFDAAVKGLTGSMADLLNAYGA